MKRSHLIAATLALAALTPAGSSALINSPDAAGYLERGTVMYRQSNYNGCIDQLLQLRHLHPTPEQECEALRYMALATLHSGDDEAIDIINAFLSRYPQSIHRSEMTACKGDYYFTRALYGDALKAYALLSTSTLPADRAEETTYRMAYSHMMLGEDAQADALFSSLTGKGGRYADAARFYRGYLAYGRQDYVTAEALLRNLDSNEEPCCFAPAYLAQINYHRGEYGEALRQARLLLDSDKTAPRMRAELHRVAGESQYNLGNYDEAARLLRTYEQTTDAGLEQTAAYMLGVMAYNDSDNATAVDYLRQAVEGNGAVAQSAYLYLGQAYAKQGNTNGALMAFENAFRRNVHDPRVAETAYYNYIAARLQGGRTPFGKNVSTMEEFLRRYPQSEHADKVRSNLINGYLSSDDYDSALRILRSIERPSAEMADAYGRVLLSLTVNTYRNGKPELATQYATEANRVKGMPDKYLSQLKLWNGLALYDLERYDESEAQIESFISNARSDNPNLALARHTLGYARFKQQDYAGAATSFRKLLDNSEFRADAYCRLADCLYAENEIDEAGKYYDKAYNANTRTGDYPLYQLAAIEGLRRNHQAKANHLNALIDRYPSSPLIPDAMMDLADTYLAGNRQAEAVELYTEINERYPEAPNGRLALLQKAITYRDMDKPKESMTTYSDVIRRYPTSDEAKVAFEDLKSIYSDQGRLEEFAAFVNAIPQAPHVTTSDLEEFAFQQAEEAYRNDASVALLNTYIAKYPDGRNMPQALYYLAYAAQTDGRYTDAADHAGQVLERYPDAAVAEDAMLLCASALAETGKYEQALELYQQLEKRASTGRLTSQAREGIMIAASRLGLADETLRAADALLATSTAGAEASRQAKFYRAGALDAKGMTQAAMDIWQELALDPADRFGANSAVSLAEAQMNAERPDLARATAEALINSGTPHNYWLARGFIVLSDALRAQGNTFEADEYLKSLQNNYPGTESDIFDMIDQRLNQ